MSKPDKAQIHVFSFALLVQIGNLESELEKRRLVERQLGEKNAELENMLAAKQAELEQQTTKLNETSSEELANMLSECETLRRDNVRIKAKIFALFADWSDIYFLEPAVAEGELTRLSHLKRRTS